MGRVFNLLWKAETDATLEQTKQTAQKLEDGLIWLNLGILIPATAAFQSKFNLKAVYIGIIQR